jgi:hypothetical protein
MENQRIEEIHLPERHFTVSAGSTTINIGSGHDLAVIAGPCVIDSRELAFNTARSLAEISQRLGIGVIFKSSYEKIIEVPWVTGKAPSWKMACRFWPIFVTNLISPF